MHNNKDNTATNRKPTSLFQAHSVPKTWRLLLLLNMAVAISGCGIAAKPDLSPTAVLDQYADIANAKYTDSLNAAKMLQISIQQLQDKPQQSTLHAARLAWQKARVPYLQTEAYRFGNPVIDDWEGQVNAWPLDEGLIDYVDTSGFFSEGNPYAQTNVIANQQFRLSGREIDARMITPELLINELHEADQIESNVATGYHAIEFLLWGQDLNGMNQGAGNRPATDFDPQNCTGGNCRRRLDYLLAVTELLISDLEYMSRQWEPNGAARNALFEAGTQHGLAMTLHGMGSFSLGELAGERIKLGLILRDPEEEQDCFSDNTHWSLFYNGLGIRDVYLGQYQRPDGTWLHGASLSDLVKKMDAQLDKTMRSQLSTTQQLLQSIVDRAESDGIAYDQMLSYDRPEDNQRLEQVIKALEDQTHSIEAVIQVLQLNSQTKNISAGGFINPVEE